MVGQPLNGGKSSAFRASRRTRCEFDEPTQLADEFIDNRLWHPAALIEVDRQRALDLSAIAGRREIGRTEDYSRGPLPKQRCHLGMQEAAGRAHREQVPAEVAFVGRGTAIYQYCDLSFTESILLLEDRGDG
jgi:hypothetical protein